MAVYGPELFGTHDRGRANALIVTDRRHVGSAIGLVSVGWLSDRSGTPSAQPSRCSAVGPLVVALLVLTRYPRNGGLELEEINPEDA
jgi:hypothetical protein